MKWYVTGRFSRQEELADRANDLVMLGDAITSRWLIAPSDRDNQTDEEREQHAVENMEDVVKCDGLISFSEEPRKVPKRQELGGRHTEFGLALGLNKRLVVIGPREHTFHYLPLVEHYNTWQDFLDELAAEIEREEQQ